MIPTDDGGRSWPFVGRDDMVAELELATSDPNVRAVVVTAPAGIGKTGLMREISARLATAPLWLLASEAASSVPLGALAGAVELDDLDAAGSLRTLAAAVASHGGLVVVDDAPHLDARTSDLLHRLVSGSKAKLIATARSTDPVPSWLEWLWLDDRTRHVALDPIAPEAIAELVSAVLPGVDEARWPAIAEGLGERTGGNALFLRELLVDMARRAVDGGPLEVGSEVPLPLRRVLDARLQVAGDSVVQALRTVAILGPVSLTVMEALLDSADIVSAEKGGWLHISSDARAIVRPAHPLYAETSLASSSAAERRGLTRSVADAVLTDPASTRTERLAAVSALVDVGAEPPIDEVVDAARTAFSALDHRLAARLAEVAVSAGDRIEARLVLGAALSGAGRPDEAESALRDALAAAVTDDERARGAGRLSVHLVAHGGRVAEASALLDSIEPEITDPVARSFIAADRAKLASIRGDLSAVTAPSPDDDELARLNASIVGAYALAMAGDADGSRSTVAEALPLAEKHSATLPWSAELVRFSIPFAALLADGPAAAVTEARIGLAGGGPVADATRGTWRFLHGFMLTVAGVLDAAQDELAEAAAELDGHDLISARPLAIAARAWAAAQAGHVGTARELIDGSLAAAQHDGRVAVQVAVADAWCDVVETGECTTAAEQKLLRAARDAADGAQVLTATLVLHQLVRVGAAAAAIAPLERLKRSAPDSWLMDFVLQRAGAELSGDDATLRRAAAAARDRWPLAEAELHAARHSRAAAANENPLSARGAFDALRVARRLGTSTPWTLLRVEDPLTQREREVAAAVAAGGSNRDVADETGVSVRTVENQLQSVYRKLGISGRKDLGDLFS